MPFKLAVSMACLMGVFAARGAFGHAHEAHHHGHEAADYEAGFAAATPAQDIEVQQCWIRLMPAQVPSAGYFEITNQQADTIELLAARTDQFALTMVHQTYEDDGMTKMKDADGVQIAPQQALSFEPGGYHLMFEQPAGSLQVGDELRLELLFGNAQSLAVDCRVNPAKARTYDG